MTRTDLAAEIYRTAYITGQFKLRSGLMSNEYFDKYRFESQPRLLKALAQHLSPLIPSDTQVLAGLEMGGIPIATALSLETGLPIVFVRKEAKSYGTCQLAEGSEIKGKKLCVVEDVVTTGGQILLSADDLRSEGAIVHDVLCVIYRGQGKPVDLEAKGLHLSSLFSMAELKSSAAPEKSTSQ